MKSIELFCASPASTSICSSMEQYTMVRHKMKQIDRQTHRLGDKLKTRTHTCLSELPLDPIPSFHQKSRKCPSKQHENRRKSSADITDIRHHSPPTNNSSRYLLCEKSSVDSELSSALVPYNINGKSSVNERVKVINNCKDLAVFRSSPARSSHESQNVYKLPSTTLGRSSQESSMSTQVHNKLTSTTLARSSNESPVYTLSSGKSNSMQLHKSSPTPPTGIQVVELRVSIHCKGCEGKVRKHLSKMEGVKSFTIDLVSKKVTVVGNVTPLSVLASMSKVKNAQFWPSPTSSSASSSSSSSSSSSRRA